MHSWTTIIALVVVFVFAIEFRPLDHYMYTYITSPRVNITESQVNTKVKLYIIFEIKISMVTVF